MSEKIIKSKSGILLEINQKEFEKHMPKAKKAAEIYGYDKDENKLLFDPKSVSTNYRVESDKSMDEPDIDVQFYVELKGGIYFDMCLKLPDEVVKKIVAKYLERNLR